MDEQGQSAFQLRVVALEYTFQVQLQKLSFLAKLLSSNNDTISTRVFNSLAIDDVYDSSIIQQCRMLESALGTSLHAVNQTLNLLWIL